MRYRVNAPNVIYEVLDGESVVLHLERGIYYSFSGSGEIVWQMVVHGYSKEEMSTALGDAVIPFLTELCDEHLICEAADVIRDGDVAVTCFEQPKLNIFSDMQELLLLDPIHDVDQKGWPQPL